MSTLTTGPIGVVGAGTMGNGIAQVCAVAGFDVILLDVNEASLAKALGTVSRNLDRLVQKQELGEDEKAYALRRIVTTTDYQALEPARLVIEAATENLAIKNSIFKQIAAVVTADAVIATNTSSLSVTALARAAQVEHSDRVIGMHFFNPVPVMRLLEIIRGLQTSDATSEPATALVSRIGKTVVTAHNSPGFAVNRILCPMINEAIFALQEGLATATDIDVGMRLGCNQPIAPLALADLIGLDTLLAVLESFHSGSAIPNIARPSFKGNGLGWLSRPQEWQGILRLLNLPLNQPSSLCARSQT